MDIDIPHAVVRGASSTTSTGGGAPPPPSRRWVPPSTLRRDDKSSNRYNSQHQQSPASSNQQQLRQQQHHAHVNNNPASQQSGDQTKDDLVFRRVRGILNKLTPEKFEKLISDILNIGLDSTTILKGVILLIFEKALDEPKYSSMYAQLCKRLAENAPNFDPPDKPCTFKRLLLNKCKDEFENRNQLCHQYEKVAVYTIASDEEDAKYLAKRKMLGNIKFIGELGKLQIIQDFILHRCCEQLLVGRRKQPISDQAEDLECLCHLMKTCGKLLDTPIAKVRMDQYFERLQRATENEQLPIRIRFLVQDIIDLRRNKWYMRRVGKGPEGPRTIQQVREDAAREGCIYMPQEASPTNLKAHTTPISMLNPFEGMFFEKGAKRLGMDDLFGGGGGYYGSGSAASFLGSSVGSYEGENDGFLGLYGNNSNNQSNNSNNTGNGTSTNGYKGTGSNDRTPSGNGDASRHHSDRNSSESRASPVTRGSGSGFEKRDLTRSNFSSNADQQQSQQQQQQTATTAPLDFGDRYSANRTRDRERRNDYNKRGPQQPSGPLSRNNNSGEPHRPYHNNNDRKIERNDSDRGRNNDFDRNSGPLGSARFQTQHQRDFPLPTSDSGSKDMTPRFNKKVVFTQPPPPLPTNPAPFSGPPNLSVPPPSHPMMGTKDVEVSLRPQQSTSNMLFKPKTPSMLPKSAISRTTDGTSPLGENSLLGPSLPPMHHKIMQQKEATILIKQGSLDAKGRKEKKAAANRGPTREEVFAKVDAIFNEYMTHQSVSEAVESWKENEWLPSKMVQTAISHFFKSLLEKSEAEKKLGTNFLDELMNDGAVNKVQCYEAISKIVSSSTLEAPARSGLAEISAWSVEEKIYTLAELADLFHGGSWHPIFLEILVQILKRSGKDQLVEMFNSASIRLIDQLPESDRTDEKLVQILESYELTFLMPLLSIRQDMAKQLNVDPNPATFSKWISENVDSSFHSQPGFILALFDVVFKHIVVQTTLPPNADPTGSPDKIQVEAEKELLSKYRSVLQQYVHEKPALQLTGVYALQVFCHEKNFPKGMLLRAFVNCYEMDIMDEHAFLQWKEDVNDTYPGKGKALFQVNQWLTWLEEAESEDDDDDEEE